MTGRRTDLPPAIEAYVRRAAVRQRRLAVARRLGLSVSVAALVAFGACLADRIFRLPGQARLALLACAGAALILPVVRPLIGLFRRIDYVRAASRIERTTPAFGQRLATLVSQSAAAPDRRGSAEFLLRITADVEAAIPLARPRKLLPWTRAAGPWFLASLAAGLLVVAWRAPWLDLPRLAIRFVVPLGTAAPVTTTQITVTPAGPARVVQGDSITIRATVTPPDVADATLRIGPRSATPMSRTAPGEFALTIPSVEQSFSYTVSAGDATTPEYAVTALPHPAVADLRVRYVYPAYARRPPLTTTSRDGVIEAPVGTHATLQVVSTEPLKSGALVFPAGRVELRPTADPRVFDADVAVTTDQAYLIELVSDQGVPARAATRLLVRSVPDRPPVVRLQQPVDDLRLDPRAVLPIWFDARDDIGIAAATAHVRVNAAAPRDVPIPLTGDARQVDTSYDLDLATFDLKVGDVVAISVGVTDGLNQAAQTDERHVLITPRTIDIATYQRLSDLKVAAKVSASLAGSLEQASTTAAELAGASTGPAALAKLSALNQHLAGAAEAETILRQSLLGALSRSDSPALSTTLANLADGLSVCTSTTARVAARVGVRGAAVPGIRDSIDSALVAARDLRARLATLSAGQQAAATLADRNNLRVAATLPATQSTAARVKRTLDRARADVTAAAVLLGMDPNAPDLDARLQQLVDAAHALTAGQSPVDYAPVAAAWAAGIGGPDRDDTFADRLDAAAAVEAGRPDADPVRVGDLQLCARAARVTQEAFASTTAAATRPAAVEARAQFAGAVAALQAEHALNRAVATTRPAADAGRVREAASEARARLRRYAGEADLLLSAADAINRQVAAAGGAPQDASQQAQKPIAEAGGPTTNAAAAPATSPPAPPADAGDAAAAAIREVQELLAAMPADLARLLQAADASRAASQRAEELRRVVATAPSDRQPAARRLADQAESARDGAMETLSSAAKPLEPAAVEALSLRLQHATPETAASAGAIDSRLSPALRLLQQAISSPDPASLDTAATLTRQAIGQVQEDLRRAQSDLADRDPVAAARWSARPPAVDRLSLTGPFVVPYPAAPQRSAPARGPDPPGYGEALEAYFQAVSKLAGGPTAGAKTE